MGDGRIQKNLLRLSVLFFSVFLLIGSASAMEFGLGNDTNLDFDVTVTYGGGIRVTDRDDDLLNDINADDANRNFDQWDFINNKITVLGDIDLSYKNVGLFVRPKAFYDHVYMSDNANDSPGTNNAYLTPGLNLDSSDQWADEIKDIHGMNAEILDLFGYAQFRLFDRDIDIRVGRQVISWGESLLIGGGISSAQSPMDVSAAVAVGTEVKEMFLPTGAAYLQTTIAEGLSLNGYYQWEWEKTRLMEGGTFFSVLQTDMLDEIKAASLFEINGVVIDPPISSRGADHEARDDGQFGIALMYTLPWFSATEVGAYYINYHDKTLLFLLNEDLSYYLDFTEDIKLYGFSVSSIIGDTNVSGEFSYRQDLRFQRQEEMEIFGEVIPYPYAEEGDYWQSQISAIHIMPLPFFADQLMIMGEVACGKEVNTEDNLFSWTYSFMLGFDWIEVLPFVDTGLNLANSDVMENPNLTGMQEGAASFSIGVDFVYKIDFKGSLTYENRYNRNPIRDRDTIALKFSYSF